MPTTATIKSVQSDSAGVRVFVEFSDEKIGTESFVFPPDVTAASVKARIQKRLAGLNNADPQLTALRTALLAAPSVE